MKRIYLSLILTAIILAGCIPSLAPAQDYKRQILGSNGLFKGWDNINDTLAVTAANIFLPVYSTKTGSVFKFNAILTAGTDSFTLYATTTEDLKVGDKPLNADTTYLSIADSFKVITAGLKVWQVDTSFVHQTGYPRGNYVIKIINRGATTGSKITRGIVRTDK